MIQRKQKIRKFIQCDTLAEYVQSYRDCLVWYWSFVEPYPFVENDNKMLDEFSGTRMGFGYTKDNNPLIEFDCEN